MSFIVRNNTGALNDRKVVSLTSASSPYTVLANDSIILVDASGGAVTVTLPTAVVGIAGKSYVIKRTDVAASSVLVTIATTSSQTIDLAPAHYLWPADTVTVVSDNANWQIIERTPYSPTNVLKGATADRRYSAVDNNRYYSPTTSTTSPAINTLWALPFHVYKTTKFDTLSFNITTGAGSSQARAGIYRDNGNCYPGALIYDTGAISTVASGVKNSTITSGVQVFPQGLYWLAWECDTTGLQAFCIGTTNNIDGIAGRGATFNSVSFYGYSVAHTFGALPDPYTAAASLLGTAPTASNPVIMLTMRPI